MDARQQLAVYVAAYKKAGDSVEKAPSAPQGRKDLTERALAVLKKHGRKAINGIGKGMERLGKGMQSEEPKCAKCGNAVSKCACGKKC